MLVVRSRGAVTDRAVDYQISRGGPHRIETIVSHARVGVGSPARTYRRTIHHRRGDRAVERHHRIVRHPLGKPYNAGISLQSVSRLGALSCTAAIAAWVDTNRRRPTARATQRAAFVINARFHNARSCSSSGINSPFTPVTPSARR
jgi:hypothetical protein